MTEDFDVIIAGSVATAQNGARLLVDENRNISAGPARFPAV